MIDPRNPPTLAPIPGAAHLTIATGTRLIHISGQTGVDEAGVIVGPTIGAQAAQAVRNLRLACAAVGATLADVARLGIYVVDLTPSAFEELVGAVVGELGEEYPETAATLLGVSALWQPGLLVEIEATVMLDA